ncbi:hypothetical protein NUSPORA_01481 [Nucleospora cyclopteri]
MRLLVINVIRSVVVEAVDSSFTDDMEVDMNSNGIAKTVISGKIKTDLDSAKTLLMKEMEGLSPALGEKISTSIQNSNIDRNKYRDLFFIKKRVINDGDREIISFDIKERLIPKTPTLSLITSDFYTKSLFICVIFLLVALVFTTTVKMYQNIIKLKYIQKISKDPNTII